MTFWSSARRTFALLEGPLLLLVWGMAVAVLLWGSGLDVAIQMWLHENYVQQFNNVMRALGQLGKGTTQVALCVLIGGMWALAKWRKNQACYRAVHDVLICVPVFLVAGMINWALKWGIGRGRPKEFLWNGTSPYEISPFSSTSQWWSFPSGHSCSTFAIAVWLGLAFPTWKWLFWGIATVLSFSRFLALTPHYMGDVIAGAAIGSCVAWSWWLLSNQPLRRGQKRIVV